MLTWQVERPTSSLLASQLISTRPGMLYTVQKISEHGEIQERVNTSVHTIWKLSIFVLKPIHNGNSTSFSVANVNTGESSIAVFNCQDYHLLSGSTETLNWICAWAVSPSAVSAMMSSVCAPGSNLSRSIEVLRSPGETIVRTRWQSCCDHRGGPQESFLCLPRPTFISNAPKYPMHHLGTLLSPCTQP